MFYYFAVGPEGQFWKLSRPIEDGTRIMPGWTVHRVEAPTLQKAEEKLWKKLKKKNSEESQR